MRNLHKHPPPILFTPKMTLHYYGPQEPEDVIQTEKYFLACNLVTGFGYGMHLSLCHILELWSQVGFPGIQFILWAICARYLWMKKNRGRYTRYRPPLLHHSPPCDGDHFCDFSSAHYPTHVYRQSELSRRTVAVLPGQPRHACECAVLCHVIFDHIYV